MGGLSDLLGGARLGMFESTPQGQGMWPQHGGFGQDASSFQAGLGGAEWQPAGGGEVAQPGDYAFTETLEDSVPRWNQPRYQQF